MFFVAPGFANNSETDYIRTFMQYVTSLGYRCAVLNHIGTIPEIPVTSSRVFSFGISFFRLRIISFSTNSVTPPAWGLEKKYSQVLEG